MQNTESLKRSIRSAEDLAGVVRTMKAMAAVSIRQYETATKSLSGYSRTVETGLTMLLGEAGKAADASQLSSNRIGAIVFGSDQGMCGQFNEQVAQFSADYLQEWEATAVPIISVGHRVADKLSGVGIESARTFQLPGSAAGITFLVQDLLPAIDEWRLGHRIGRILVFHNRRLTASSWRPSVLQLLPLRLDRIRQQEEAAAAAGRSLPLWTMETNILFSRLVKQFLFVSLFRACAESLAGENASRIAAMQSAERNINERLHELRSEYSQQRQTTITEELLDVVTGFEALKDSAF